MVTRIRGRDHWTLSAEACAGWWECHQLSLSRTPRLGWADKSHKDLSGSWRSTQGELARPGTGGLEEIPVSFCLNRLVPCSLTVPECHQPRPARDQLSIAFRNGLHFPCHLETLVEQFAVGR